MTATDSPQPIGVVVATHGDMARALIASAEMIVGAQDNVVAVCLEHQDSLESFHAALNAAIRQAERGAGVLVLIDLFGGTPGNAASLSAHEQQLHVVSGVNLPMLLEVFLSRTTMSPAALAAHALESGKAGIVDIAAKVREQGRLRK